MMLGLANIKERVGEIGQRIPPILILGILAVMTTVQSGCKRDPERVVKGMVIGVKKAINEINPDLKRVVLPIPSELGSPAVVNLEELLELQRLQSSSNQLTEEDVSKMLNFCLKKGIKIIPVSLENRQANEEDIFDIESIIKDPIGEKEKKDLEKAQRFYQQNGAKYYRSLQREDRPAVAVFVPPHHFFAGDIDKDIGEGGLIEGRQSDNERPFAASPIIFIRNPISETDFQLNLYHEVAHVILNNLREADPSLKSQKYGSHGMICYSSLVWLRRNIALDNILENPDDLTSAIKDLSDEELKAAGYTDGWNDVAIDILNAIYIAGEELNVLAALLQYAKLLNLGRYEESIKKEANIHLKDRVTPYFLILREIAKKGVTSKNVAAINRIIRDTKSLEEKLGR